MTMVTETPTLTAPTSGCGPGPWPPSPRGTARGSGWQPRRSSPPWRSRPSPPRFMPSTSSATGSRRSSSRWCSRSTRWASSPACSLAGHVSDWMGRRRVLIPALAIEVLAAVLFLVWPALPGLIVARFVSGLGIGMITASATAYLRDLHALGRPGAGAGRFEVVSTAANLGGLGVGTLVSGALAQFVRSPLAVPYARVRRPAAIGHRRAWPRPRDGATARRSVPATGPNACRSAKETGPPRSWRQLGRSWVSLCSVCSPPWRRVLSAPPCTIPAGCSLVWWPSSASARPPWPRRLPFVSPTAPGCWPASSPKRRA